jgi:murein tripeptide amidase MpaA
MTVNVSFDHYHDYDEVTGLLRDWAVNYASLSTLETIGKTPQGRDLWVLTLTNKGTGKADEKPGFWIDGNTHAGEVTGTEACLKAIHHLLTGYGKDPEVTELLDSTAVYVMPRVNPDGSEIYLITPHSRTSGGIPNPEFEDEFAEGLYPEDLNGDGYITMMRLRDPNGDWKASEKDPRVLVKRRPEDRGGVYYRVYREGLIKGYREGEVKMAPSRWKGGSNRNFPAGWSPTQSGQGGLFPLWEPEIRAIADYFYEHKNIGGLLTYHTYSGIVMRPYALWGDKHYEEKELEKDLAVYNALGAIGAEMSGWPVLSPHEEMTLNKKAARAGCSMDWWYDHFGLLMFGIEIWDMPSRAGFPNFHERGMRFVSGDLTEEENLKLLAWIDEQTGGEGFQNWTLYDHPQLGSVEIGGVRTKYVMQNPPTHLLDSALDKIYTFPIKLATMLPHVKITESKVEPLGDGVYRVKAEVSNLGFLPTNLTEQRKKIKLDKPVKVKIELGEGVELLAGRERFKLGNLEGRSDRLPGHPSYGVAGGKPEGSKKTVEWTVRAKELPASVRITSISLKGGRDTAEVELA